MELGIMHSAGSGVPTTTSSHMPGMLSSPAESPSAAKLPDGCLPPYVVVGAPRAQVMTDEQLETLRRQISVYATICQQLVEMHKATMAQQNAISGRLMYTPWPTVIECASDRIRKEMILCNLQSSVYSSKRMCIKKLHTCI